jgi:PKD repeat protein
VELRVFNGDAACTQSQIRTIIARCPVHASFVVARTAITPGESLTFTSTSTNGTTFEWLIEGAPAGTGEIFTRTFKDAGGYRIALVASNGECSDTSASVYIRVSTCAATGLWSFWYFGNNAGIDFNGGSPVVVNDGALATEEGVASISDNDGRLLFYSDGRTIWNREHKVMMNGSGLGGSGISAQSALIVPLPGSDSRYYIFTTPDWQAPSTTLQYSMIDMSLDNGRGGVTSTKNVVLNGNVAERVTAVPQRGCGNIWIVSHEKGNNHFVVYLITPAGLITTPTISAMGSITQGNNRFGGIKFSQDGRRLCSTLGGSQEDPTVELFDFDAANGIIDNPRVLMAHDELRNAYSSEFSPNGRFLYVWGLGDKNLYQYDLVNGTANAIRASRSVVARASGEFGPLQLGPDGRIYVVNAHEPFLSRIEYPNQPASACGFVPDAIALSPGSTGIGLPNFPSGYIDRRLHVTGERSLCIADSFAFYRAVSRGCLAVAGRWSVAGDAEIIASTDSTATLHLKSAGSALLIIEKDGECGTLIDTLSIAIERLPRVDLGPDTAVCAGSPLLLDAGGDYGSYLWQDGSRGRTLLARNPGVYWAEVSLGRGCTARDTITILPDDGGLALHLGPDTSLCNGGTCLLDAGPGATSYRWQDGSTGRTYTAYRPGLYWVEAMGRCGIVADTIVINPAAPGIDLGPDTSACGDIDVTLDAGPGFDGYAWQDGSTGRTYHVREPGIYVVRGRLGACESIGSISITRADNGLASHLGPDTLLCNGDTRLLDAGPGFDSYKWQDGSTGRTYTAHGPGVYRVEATGPCGVVADTIIINPGAPGIDLGPDTSACGDIDLTLDAGPGFDGYEWQDGSTGRTYHAHEPGVYVVRGRLGGCESVGSIRIVMSGSLAVTATLGSMRAISAAPGDEVRLPLLLASPSDAGLAGQAFTAVVRVKRGLLMPVGDTPPGVVVGGDRVITLSGVIGTSDTVAVLRFLTLLGDSDRAAIVIDSVGVTNSCVGAVTRDSLEVAIQACQTGGTRLVGIGGTAALRVMLPVAPGGTATIDYVLAEDGATRLSLVNVLGERLRVLVNERLSAGSHGERLRLRDLPAGLYFVLLETPTQALVEKFVVER